MRSVNRQQKHVTEDHCSGEKLEALEPGAIYHCHGNAKAKALENRASEQVYAKWKLWAASGICFVFMIAEVVGEYFSTSLLWLNKQTKSYILTGGWPGFSFESES